MSRGEVTREEMVECLTSIEGQMKEFTYPTEEETNFFKAIRALIEHGPEVSREFVEKWAKSIDIHDYDPGLALSSEKIVLRILVEAGVTVMEG